MTVFGNGSELQFLSLAKDKVIGVTVEKDTDFDLWVDFLLHYFTVSEINLALESVHVQQYVCIQLSVRTH